MVTYVLPSRQKGIPGMIERSIDQDLVARVQAGEKAAFDLLVRKYQHKIAKLISRYIYDHAEV